ncbi:hypothetical protein D3C79_1077330 [compost metagenome]
MLFIVFKDSVEAEVVHDFLPCHPDNQAAFIHLLDLSHTQHISHEGIVVRRINAIEGR